MHFSLQIVNSKASSLLLYYYHKYIAYIGKVAPGENSLPVEVDKITEIYNGKHT